MNPKQPRLAAYQGVWSIGIVYPHRIRLRGPWECEPLEADAGHAAPAARRVTMPCGLSDAGLVGFRGQVRLRRRFGYPGRIDADERVWLTVAGLSQRAEISLNGTSLGTVDATETPWQRPITELLRERNELVVLLDAASDTDGLWGEVAMEIRRTASLEKVAARWVGNEEHHSLVVTGHVVGASDRPLELYALLDGKNVHYSTIAPSAAGTPFDLLIDDEALVASGHQRHAPPRQLRLELIDGGVVWYGVELPLERPQYA